jgi:hypothetical protein
MAREKDLPGGGASNEWSPEGIAVCTAPPLRNQKGVWHCACDEGVGFRDQQLSQHAGNEQKAHSEHAALRNPWHGAVSHASAPLMG